MIRPALDALLSLPWAICRARDGAAARPRHPAVFKIISLYCSSRNNKRQALWFCCLSVCRAIKRPYLPFCAFALRVVFAFDTQSVTFLLQSRCIALR